MSRAVDHIIDEIADQYHYADDTSRPWIIGFSGGKDSTVLLQLVWKALEKVKALLPFSKRDVHVVCNDTMIENPVITTYVHEVLDKIENAAREQGLPIYVQKTIPRLEDSFWVNMIGRGYPAPNNKFRWCTERLKIRPTSRFISERLKDNKDGAVILIGTRSDESSSRAQSVKKHSIRGKRLTPHPNHQKTFVYAPIKDLMTEEIWYIINTMPSPWGSDNSVLFKIYSDASADDYECPTMVTNKKHSSCGQSRFGCWSCTLVKEDKSMSGLIESGYDWLKPLLSFRNQIYEERNDPMYRMPTLRNGRPAVNDMGTLTSEYKAILLRRLLTVQKEIQQHKPEFKLITNQELIAIQVIWYRDDLIFNNRVQDIYGDIYNKDLDMKSHEEKRQKEEQEKALLKKVFGGNQKKFNLMQDLLSLQKNKALLTRKRGLKEDIEKRIEEYLKDKEN